MKVCSGKRSARAALDALPKKWTKTDIQNVADKNEAADIRKWLSYFAKREGVTVFSKMTGYTTMTVWRVE